MKTAERTAIRPGQVYRYHHLKLVRQDDGSKQPVDVPGYLYRVETFAFDGVSRRDVVVCVGLEGPDCGLYFIHTLMRFARQFHEEEAAPAEAKTPLEKAAGRVTTEGNLLKESI